jgi:hypothetical protein
MSTVWIYDVARRQWYEQVTTGEVPSALTQGCSVLASAQDGSSHNIYWYGGFNGYNITSTLSDDVWTLSIPSFIWTKLYSGNSSYGRAGHVCSKPYPDQMIVIGGYNSLGGVVPTCLNDFARVFNLSSGLFLDKYDPTVWTNYSIPTAIFSAIGGNGSGGATLHVPTPLGFTNSNLSSLFSEVYNSSKITTWYPSATALSLGQKNSGLPKYLGPVLGVVLGVLFIIALIVIWIWRRRLSRHHEGPYTYSEDDKMIDPLGGMRGKAANEIDGKAMHEAGGTAIYEIGMLQIPSTFTSCIQSREYSETHQKQVTPVRSNWTQITIAFFRMALQRKSLHLVAMSSPRTRGTPAMKNKNRTSRRQELDL